MISQLIPGDGLSIFLLLQALSIVLFLLFILFFPKIMMWQINRKMRDTMIDLEHYKNTTEEMFLNKLSTTKDPRLENKFESMKDFKLSAPTGIDPTGLVQKLEHVLDNSENKFDRFIDQYAETENADEKADLQMAFKGVMGTHQIYKITKHFQELINKTGNFQLVTMIQMMLPIYKELAEAQKDATRAFTDEAPIGDSIGPLVAARLITEEPEEIAQDIIHSQETIEDQEVHILKSNGPGARLGKYGDALDKIAQEHDLKAVITVDAAAKLESEETGAVSEGVGVMMGGPGVEKTKIEETAQEHEIPLEGIIVKQSPPEASKPMKKEIYEAYEEAELKTKEIIQEFDGPVAVVGVGNTCGIPNTREQTRNVHQKLHKYWKEYEQQDEDDVSYTGIMGLFGGPDQQYQEIRNSFLWRNIR